MKLIRPNDIPRIVGISAVTAYRLEKSGQFPARRRISARCVGWIADEVTAWMEGRDVVVPVRDITRIGKGKPGPGRGHRKQA